MPIAPRGPSRELPGDPPGRGAAVSILVVDDHPVVREGLAAILSDEPGFRVVGEAASGEAALREAVRLRPRVVVIDGRLPSLSAADTCVALRERLPGVRLVLAVTFFDRSSATRARSFGVHGLVLKDSEPATIRDAVRSVAAGKTFFDARARTKSAGDHGRSRERRPFALTPRELSVLELLPRGMTNNAIGAELWISEDTVKTHVKSILHKLGARDRVEAAVIALREGLI